jgi:hypothetical protein
MLLTDCGLALLTVAMHLSNGGSTTTATESMAVLFTSGTFASEAKGNISQRW